MKIQTLRELKNLPQYLYISKLLDSGKNLDALNNLKSLYGSFDKNTKFSSSGIFILRKCAECSLKSHNFNQSMLYLKNISEIIHYQNSPKEDIANSHLDLLIHALKFCPQEVMPAINKFKEKVQIDLLPKDQQSIAHLLLSVK